MSPNAALARGAAGARRPLTAHGHRMPVGSLEAVSACLGDVANLSGLPGVRSGRPSRVAQLAEQPAVNRQVIGSSPIAGATKAQFRVYFPTRIAISWTLAATCCAQIATVSGASIALLRTDASSTLELSPADRVHQSNVAAESHTFELTHLLRAAGADRLLPLNKLRRRPGQDGAMSYQGPTATGVNERSLRSLRSWNLVLTLLHLGQAVAVLVLATDFAIPVTRSLPTGPPGTPPGSPEELFDLPIGASVAVFLALAAVDHLLTATIFRRTYEDDLRAGINRFRWIEYSFSATLMVILIALYTGIDGISALIGIAGANVAMILFGWLQEAANPPGRSTATMRPFWFGCIAATAPWLAIGYNLVGRRTGPRLRGRHLRLALRVLQQFRSQPVAAVPAGRSVAKLRLRREGLPRAQPGGEVRAGLADLCRLAGVLTPEGRGAGGGRRPPLLVSASSNRPRRRGSSIGAKSSGQQPPGRTRARG